VISSVSCSTGGWSKRYSMDTVFMVALQSRLIDYSRAGGRSRRRQAKALPPRASLRTGVFNYGSVGNGGVVRNVLRLAHTLPISKQCGSDYDHIASPESAARTLTASVQVAITWRGAPPKEGPRGIFHPRSVRPRPPHRRRGLVVVRITSRPSIKSLVSMPQPHSWNRPLPTWDLQLLPTEPPGALWVSARIPHGFPASPASSKDTERAIPSN
jgi:hypothetical protein